MKTKCDGNSLDYDCECHSARLCLRTYVDPGTSFEHMRIRLCVWTLLDGRRFSVTGTKFSNRKIQFWNGNSCLALGKTNQLKSSDKKKTNRKNIRRELMLVACACSMWPTLASIYYPAHRRHFSLLFFLSLSFRFYFFRWSTLDWTTRCIHSVLLLLCCLSLRALRVLCSVFRSTRKSD